MQGVDIGSGIISGVGQADDVLLTLNDIFSLQNLVHLTSSYCHKYSVQLCVDKTKLLAISSKYNQPIRYRSMVSQSSLPLLLNTLVSSAQHLAISQTYSTGSNHIRMLWALLYLLDLLEPTKEIQQLL